FPYTATSKFYTLSYTTLFRSWAPVPCQLRRRTRRQKFARGRRFGTGRVRFEAGLSRVRFDAVEEARLVERAQRSGTRSSGRQERSEEHTSELQSRSDLVCRLL